MAMEVRLSMRKIREILRLRFDCKLTIRQISVSIRVSTGAVTKYLNLFEQILYKGKPVASHPRKWCAAGGFTTKPERMPKRWPYLSPKPITL